MLELKTRLELWVGLLRCGLVNEPSWRNQTTGAGRKIKASVRATVEYSFFYIKQVFGCSKVRYRGLAKNTNQLCMLAGLMNLFFTRI